MSLNTIAEDYFKNLNSISTRLYHDLEEVKSSYEDLWDNIPEEERQIILSESVIKPEIIIKYNPTEKKTKEDFAVKLIFDENCSYRDEHSGPFSFKTQSQRDLSILCNKKSENFTENRIKLPVMKPKAPPPPPKPTLFYKEPEEESSLDTLDSDSTNSLLPKTGLDFLDNW